MSRFTIHDSRFNLAYVRAFLSKDEEKAQHNNTHLQYTAMMSPFHFLTTLIGVYNLFEYSHAFSITAVPSLYLRKSYHYRHHDPTPTHHHERRILNIHVNQKIHQGRRVPISYYTTALQMGLLDKISSFFEARGNDFIPIEEMDTIGPPVILLVNCPDGISDEELEDMVSDGAPKAYSLLRVKRMKYVGGENEEWLESPVENVLNKIASEKARVSSIMNLNDSRTSQSLLNDESKNKITVSYDINTDNDQAPSLSNYERTPIVYCSGIQNEEMMNVYRIIAREIYEETGGTAQAACAKFVPGARKKPLTQIIEEISGDHQEALGTKYE